MALSAIFQTDSGHLPHLRRQPSWLSRESEAAHRQTSPPLRGRCMGSRLRVRGMKRKQVSHGIR